MTNHVAKAQVLRADLGIGAAILDQIESGGFLATHPGTADRIDAARKMP